MPLLPYMSGTWETIWYTVDATDWPLPARITLFLVAFQTLYAVVLLPVAYYGGLALPRSFGLSRQHTGSWLADWVKGSLLGGGLGVFVGVGFFGALWAFGEFWWIAFGMGVTVLTVGMVFLAPYLLVPLFFKMRPIDDQAAAERIRALLRRAGSDLQDVCSLDFSRRTAEANAAVIGLGRSRRVVLADTLLAEFEPREVDVIVAHEFGHHRDGHVARLLVAYLVAVWAGLAAGQWLLLAALPVLSLPGPGYVPGYPALFGVVQLYLFLVAPITNAWSRRLEVAADRYALRLTGDPQAFAEAMMRLACQNLVELSPPRWAELLLGTHPSPARRIAMARAWSN